MAAVSNPDHPTKRTATIQQADGAAIDHAAALLAAGEAVAVPTETVYGLAADATKADAVARIYAIKGRPSFNPLICHVDSLARAEILAQVDDVARQLADAFWPGPLTMVLPLHPSAPVARIVTAGLNTIAVRMPAHPVMRALIAAVDRPLAAPSANASGSISPTTVQHVMRSIGDRISLILDAGPCDMGLESTIVRPVTDAIQVLRPGPITPMMLEQATGIPVIGAYDGRIIAPGQMTSHYAPGKPMQLDCHTPAPGCFHIGFGDGPCDYQLSADGDLTEAAARLFDALHAAADAPQAHISVSPIPAHGLGIAICDRLARAAA